MIEQTSIFDLMHPEFQNRQANPEYLSVEFESCGHNGERMLSLSRRANEWLAFGKEEKAKAAEAIEYALSMGAKDETGEGGGAPEAGAAEGEE